MPDVGDINPLLPIWPIRPEDKDTARRRKRPPEKKDKPRPESTDKDDDKPGHVDEYASGDNLNG